MERLAIDGALVELVSALARACPERLGHVDASRILFVGGAARLEARASIRPLVLGPRAASRWVKPKITIRGVRMLYEVCLRPRFFLNATPAERLWTIVHELWHVSPAFDGTLAHERRHSARAGGASDEPVQEVLRAFGEASAAGFLEHQGELRIAAWLSRPPTLIAAGSARRLDYDERDLYSAIVEQR